MKNKTVILTGIFILIILLTSLYFANSASKPDDSTKIIEGAKLPPTGTVTRKYPLLVNYFHMDYDESMLKNREERLAQWDIIIINNDEMVLKDNISFDKIRKTHPDIKILVWIPFGQEPYTGLFYDGIPKENNPDNWYAKTVKGDYIRPHWGGHMMNPYKKNFAWAKYTAKFVKENYLTNGMYDGVMFDCLGEFAASWASNDYPKTFDTDENGIFNDNDHKLYREGVIYLIQTLQAECPDSIITGNGGIPWTMDCPYFNFANGNMHENALGNEFGSLNEDWLYNFTGMQTCLNPPNTDKKFKRYHFFIPDVVYNRTIDQAKNLKKLTEMDKKRMRFGLTTAMLLDGYFGFDRGDCNHGQLWWFDEYDVDIGNPKNQYEINKYFKGSYSRDFDNGIIVVNPKSYTVTVKFKINYEDASTGITGTNFKIPAYDGRIFFVK